MLRESGKKESAAAVTVTVGKTQKDPNVYITMKMNRIPFIFSLCFSDRNQTPFHFFSSTVLHTVV